MFFHSDRATPLTFKNIDELGLNYKASFTSNDVTIRNPRFNLQAQMVYKLSPEWTSQTVLSRGSIKSDGIYTYIWDFLGGVDYFSQMFHNENFTTNTTDIQQNFNGDFKIGKMRNRLLVGLDAYHRVNIDNGSGWEVGRLVKPSGEVLDTDPGSGDPFVPVDLSMAAIDNLLAGSGVNNATNKNTSYAAYASDVLNITPGLMAMVSLRADYFNAESDDFNQWALSPKFGLVYQPVVGKVSIFASYMNAFINVAPSALYDDNGDPTGEFRTFKPEHANQWEGV
ncbi:TonB-dependent receptor [Chitinophaga horti]|uniref:TonB-dependent receptor n=1 Tax=Chitinophaga horti TaxID=2920382 RepID=A0ABY6JAS4_9BACT|nr:TonB-dependent receptor [Chitinophaga horti]UYQ95396.1 TonB-dependent receptor [Chitinophaga horti]